MDKDAGDHEKRSDETEPPGGHKTLITNTWRTGGRDARYVYMAKRVLFQFPQGAMYT